MNISIIGVGYVGLVTGACFADMGNNVICIDKDLKKIENLKKGIIPIHEKGLEEIVDRNLKEGRLKFNTQIDEGIKDSLFIFIAVGTQSKKDGSADLSHVFDVASEIGDKINDYKIIVNKSTVPVGTADKVKNIILDKLKKRNKKVELDVVSNPEFLKEGDAVNDFMSPDRVIIGTKSQKASNYLKELYSVFFKKHPRVIFMDERSAEVTKYASNAMLATKISFINEIANFCECVNADIEMVRLGIGADQRIGYSFIYPGIGYGGSCFPKDIRALIFTANQYNYKIRLLSAVEEVNNFQKEKIFLTIKNYFSNKKEKLNGKRIAIWGISFKPETNDIRESPALTVVQRFIEEGAFINMHDPVALSEAKDYFKELSDKINYFENNYDCLIGCDALALLTEWHIYRQPNFNKIKENLKQPVIFDGRNQYDPEKIHKYGIKYYGIGRKLIK